MLKGELTGVESTLLKLGAMSDRIKARIDTTMTRLAIQVSANVKEKKLSGQVLNVRTGRLRRSINYKLAGLGTGRVTAVVGTNVVYARIHEFGGEVRGRVMPERSYLRSTLSEMGDEIKSQLAQAVRSGIK